MLSLPVSIYEDFKKCFDIFLEKIGRNFAEPFLREVVYTQKEMK